MRESVGATFTLNMIVIFIVVVVGILAATLSYYKAFKVNNRILSEIEKFEGYNSSAKKSIDNEVLPSLGYQANPTNSSCDSSRSDGGKLVSDTTPSRLYCVYYYEDDRGKNEKSKTNQNKKPIYYNYSVVTYIYIQLPIAGLFKVPVYTKGERTYNFSCKKCTSKGGCKVQSDCGSGGRA